MQYEKISSITDDNKIHVKHINEKKAYKDVFKR